jgi:predicted small lipoprotein YifL
MHNSIKSITGLLLVLLFVGGCGQKGPLFLPGTPTEIRSVPEQAETNAEGDEAEDMRRRAIQNQQ